MMFDWIVVCNVLVFNIGMIVKCNLMNKFWIVVSNILDIKLVEKVKVIVYNF